MKTRRTYKGIPQKGIGRKAQFPGAGEVTAGKNKLPLTPAEIFFIKIKSEAKS